MASETDASPPAPQSIDLPQQLGVGARVGPEGVLGGGRREARRPQLTDAPPSVCTSPGRGEGGGGGRALGPQSSSSGAPRAHPGPRPRPFITCASPSPPRWRAGVSGGLSWHPESSLCPRPLTRPSLTVFPAEAQQNGAPPGPGEAAGGAVMEGSAALPAQNPSTSGYLWASGRSLGLPGPIRGMRPLEGAGRTRGSQETWPHHHSEELKADSQPTGSGRQWAGTGQAPGPLPVFMQQRHRV